MTPDEPASWRWKVGAAALNEQLDLLYEPGNWGDVLKGIWAVLVTRALCTRAAGTADANLALTLLDPWAGAPTWPLLPGAIDRLAALEAASGTDASCVGDPSDKGHATSDARRAAPHAGSPYVADQRELLAAGRLASTGRLVRAAAATSGRTLHARVFDLSDARRALWAAEPDTEVLPLHDGAEALDATSPPADLLLVDPYDLFETADALLPRVLARRDGAALLYLFNKAPRGASLLARYERLRDGLRDGAAASGWTLLVGRIPSDARLPRAFHEVLLLAPPDLAAALRAELRAATAALSVHLAAQGAFEEEDGADSRPERAAH